MSSSSAMPASVTCTGADLVTSLAKAEDVVLAIVLMRA